MYRIRVNSPFENWKKGDLPDNPYVSIAINSHTTDERGIPQLSPKLYTDQEVDETIDHFIKELEEFRNEAKKELKRIYKKMRE